MCRLRESARRGCCSVRVPARRAIPVRPLENLTALEIVRAGPVVLAAKPLADVAVAVGVHIHAVALLLPHIPVPGILVARVIVVDAVAMPLAVLHVAHILIAIVKVRLRALRLVIEQPGAFPRRLWPVVIFLICK